MKPQTKGRHNNASSVDNKSDLRRAVLERVGEARVLDAFAGPVGEMYWSVWKDASSYLGIDAVYKPWDPRPRIVCETSLALRTLDLQRFNVFDVDAFGSPWECLRIIQSRRRWAPGERGAIIVTDGSWRSLRTHGASGSPFKSMVALAGLPDTYPVTYKTREHLFRSALSGFCSSSGLKPLGAWVDKPSAKTSKASMIYGSVVFESTGKDT